MMQIHYAENTEVKRFQELIEPDFWLSADRRQKRSTQIDLSKIDKVPIEYFSHADDEACPYNVMLDMYKTIEAPIVLH